MKKIVLALLLALSVVGFSQESRAEVSVRENQVVLRIFFGMGVGSAAVSPDMLRDFVEKEVTPRFPVGLNIEPASVGQWMSSQGLIREKNLVVNIVTDNNEDTFKKVAEIGERYASRFEKAKASLFVVPIPIEKCLHYR